MEDDDNDSEDENDDYNNKETMEAYLAELRYKYLSYTHCTVVEFTQEEGYVGIPLPIASALLDAKNQNHNHQNASVLPVDIP